MNCFTLQRLSYKLYKARIPVLPKVIQLLILFLFNSYLPYQLKVPRSCRAGHRGISLVINKETVLGENILIRAHVTIGKKESDKGAPIISDNVTIGDGAKILGDIVVGKNAVIGANAVVIKHVSENQIVGGVPARHIGTVEHYD